MRSDEWDRKERQRSVKPQPFNIKLMVIVGIILFACIFFYAYTMLPQVYADSSKVLSSIFPEKGGYKTFKVFDDGVMYKTSKSWMGTETIEIIYDGVTIDCEPDGYHMNQYLNPICVEIIMRTSLEAQNGK